MNSRRMKSCAVCLLMGVAMVVPSWMGAAESTSSLYSQVAVLQTDTLNVDTLREVEVLPNIRMPLSSGLKRDVDLMNWQDRNSLGGLLNRIAPQLHDQIMHPFGFKERKKSRKRKKVNKILEQYDAVGRSDLEYRMMLDSVVNAERFR